MSKTTTLTPNNDLTGMKTTFCVLVFSLLFQVGLAQAGNKSDEAVAIDGYDPVAYFTMTEAARGSESINHVWLDETWLFVNEEHKTLFAANPMRYMPNYGGYCSYDAYELGHGHGVDPTAWRIVDGKLYLFRSEATAAHAIPTVEWEKVKAGLAQ